MLIEDELLVCVDEDEVMTVRGCVEIVSVLNEEESCDEELSRIAVSLPDAEKKLVVGWS